MSPYNPDDQSNLFGKDAWEEEQRKERRRIYREYIRSKRLPEEMSEEVGLKLIENYNYALFLATIKTGQVDQEDRTNADEPLFFPKLESFTHEFLFNLVMLANYYMQTQGAESLDQDSLYLLEDLTKARRFFSVKNDKTKKITFQEIGYENSAQSDQVERGMVSSFGLENIQPDSKRLKRFHIEMYPFTRHFLGSAELYGCRGLDQVDVKDIATGSKKYSNGLAASLRGANGGIPNGVWDHRIDIKKSYPTLTVFEGKIEKFKVEFEEKTIKINANGGTIVEFPAGLFWGEKLDLATIQKRLSNFQEDLIGCGDRYLHK